MGVQGGLGQFVLPQGQYGTMCLHDAMGTRREGRRRDEGSRMREEGDHGNDLVISVEQEGGGRQMALHPDEEPTIYMVDNLWALHPDRDVGPA